MSAWLVGEGEKIAKAKIKRFTEEALIKVYKAKGFARALNLKEMAGFRKVRASVTSAPGSSSTEAERVVLSVIKEKGPRAANARASAAATTHG
jgi:hypothetical protein